MLELSPFWWRMAAYAVIAAVLFGYGWFRGNEHGSQKLFNYQAEEAKETVRIVTARGQVTERVVTKYVKVAGETKVITKTIEKEVARYAEKNRTFTLDTEWRSLHDAAALNRVPTAASGADAAGGAPTAAEALETVTANYAACNRTADRLDGLQEWVRQQAAVR